MPFVPREGITLEFLTQPWIKLLLQPIVTGALLVAAIRRPESAQTFVARFFHGKVSLDTLKTSLSWLVGLGSLHHANQYLSRMAYNNWTIDKSWDWSKEVVVVTGGSSGMGEAMVRQFAAKGIKVAIIDIQDPLNKNLPSNVQFFHADLSSVDSIQAVAAAIRGELGDSTVLINCAGIGTTRRSVADESPEFVQRIFAVNAMSHFHLVREFLPAMLQRNHGHVVNVASAAGLAVFAGNVAYGASKAAAIALHEGLAQEIRHRHKALKVRTSLVLLAWVRTPMVQSWIDDPKFTSFMLEPETVADAVVGQVLKGEGGQIVLPGRLSHAVTMLRGLPLWIQESIRDGLAHACD